MNDLYQTVTDRILSALAAGVPPWVAPWQSGVPGLPNNLATGKPYRGINVLMLFAETQRRGFVDSRWLTYKQAAELGAQVRKGETGTPVVFFKWREVASKAESEADADDTRVVPMLRGYTVFNAEQLKDLPACHQTPSIASWSPLDLAEDMLLNSGAHIQHGGSRAYYSPGEDVIQLPPMPWFNDAQGYYGTALHELTHWTGHPSRCNRPLGRRHGIDAYAFEELVAEMGSAFLCAHCGLPGHLEHASYLDRWIQALRGDKRLIFVAAGKAQAAADYLLALSTQPAVQSAQAA